MERSSETSTKCLEIYTGIRVQTTNLEFVAGENLVLSLLADSRPVCPMI